MPSRTIYPCLPLSVEDTYTRADNIEAAHYWQTIWNAIPIVEAVYQSHQDFMLVMGLKGFLAAYPVAAVYFYHLAIRMVIFVPRSSLPDRCAALLL